MIWPCPDFLCGVDTVNCCSPTESDLATCTLVKYNMIIDPGLVNRFGAGQGDGG